jgi:NitT/TauT family transport system substrate-binding protein
MPGTSTMMTVIIIGAYHVGVTLVEHDSRVRKMSSSVLARECFAKFVGVILSAFSFHVQAQERLTVQTGSLDGVHAALFLASQKGWFRDAGFDVSIMDGKGSATAIQQVSAGQGDIAYSQLATMAAAIDHGMDLISIACFVRAGDNGVMVGSNTSIKVPKDLIQKRIAFATGTASAALMDGFFKKAGLSREQMTLVGVDLSTLAALYVSGQVDAAVNTIAYFGPIVSGSRPSHAIPFSEAGIRVPGVGLIIRKSDEIAKANMFTRFVPVTVRAWKYISDGHAEEAVDAMMAQKAGNRMDRAVLIGQVRAYLEAFDTPATTGKGIGWQSESDWMGAIEDLKGAGLIQKNWQPKEFYTNRFLPKS